MLFLVSPRLQRQRMYKYLSDRILLCVNRKCFNILFMYQYLQYVIIAGITGKKWGDNAWNKKLNNYLETMA